MELRPPPQKWNFLKIFHFCGKVSRFRFQRALNHPSSSYARKRDFGLLCPNKEIRPQAPKNGIFQNFFYFCGKVFLLLTSPQLPQDIKSKSSYARKRDYAQIWKFSPMLPKMEFFKKNSFF